MITIWKALHFQKAKRRIKLNGCVKFVQGHPKVEGHLKVEVLIGKEGELRIPATRE
jgi:hypothetical protein